jgi:phenylacetate-CoA ligase
MEDPFIDEPMKITPLDPWILAKFNSNQPTLEREELTSWQLKKVNETIAIARQKSSFYREHFQRMPESIHNLSELSLFPFTTPEDIRRNPLRFICVSQDSIDRVVTLDSSGTTGEPKRIYFTADDQELTIDFFAVGMSTFTKPGDKVLIFLPGQTPGSVGDLLRLGLARFGRDPIPYGPIRDSQNALEVINNKKADCLVGSPTQILGLAQRWQPNMHKPRCVLLSTDHLPSAIVDKLKSTWSCEVFDHYGATEMGLGGGVECEAHNGYHLREADLFFEIVDPETGSPVREGDYGDVVVTTLTRVGMPLIRYRMGDRSRFITNQCDCGTNLKNLEQIRGRFGGFVQIGNNTLKLADFDEVLFAIPGLLNFTISVTIENNSECVDIRAHMLTDVDSRTQIENAISNLPSMASLKRTITCQHAPNEVGSILKRKIIDQRGQNA